MAFRSANLDAHFIKFNSAASSDLIDAYTSEVDKAIEDKLSEPAHRSFAPSSFRCPRISWFRLRGVEPDKLSSIDYSLNFTADIGTACHRIIQERLSRHFGADWISLEDYLKENPPDFEYTLTPSGDGFETLVEVHNPPVRFACDGLVRINGIVYLLEIKSSEYESFQNLTEPKQNHKDQIKCYASLLGIEHVLVLYIDRMYGNLKCFEITVNIQERSDVRAKMKYIMDMVDANIAPEGLPIGDPGCSPNMCPYNHKCKEWGR